MNKSNSPIIPHSIWWLKATYILWGHLEQDAIVGGEYGIAIAQMSNETVERVETGCIPVDDALAYSTEARNRLMDQMRRRSTAAGRLAAWAIKPAGRDTKSLVQIYSRTLFGRGFGEVGPEQARQVRSSSFR